jgi:hypothetical protein
MNMQTKRGKAWCAGISDVHEELTTVTAKTKNLDELRAYLAVYDRLWAENMKRRWGHAKLRLYGGKRRVLDNFFSDMAKDLGPDATVFWGDAEVNSSMRGTKSAPTKSQLVRARMHLKKIVLVDEYRTSKVCHCCDGQLHAR